MNPFTNWGMNSWEAAGKHVASYAAGGVTVAVAWGFLSSSQGSDLTTDVNMITHGVGEVVKGVAGIAAALTPLYTAWRAAHNATPPVQASNLEAAVPGTIVVTSPEVAAQSPSPNVVSNTSMKVVSQ